MSDQETSALSAAERRDSWLRWLYLPYAALVLTPCLALSMLFWGLFAMLLALVSPRLAFHCGTVWCWCMCRLNFTRVVVDGRARAAANQSYVIMSNHQSLFDVLAFYGHWGRQFRWVIKRELRRIPGLGWYCAAGGHIFVDRSSHPSALRALKAAKPLLEGGISVMIFPEGTRSRDGRLGPLKWGGFMIALELGLPILPVSISGSRHVLPSHDVRPLPGTIRIQVHEPIDPLHYGQTGREQLMAAVRDAIASGLPLEERGDVAAARD